jgi:N-methylhydantoinase A/oxoprolinase/acetone carboxylase beta subunit
VTSGSRLAFDIGGTFTDLVISDHESLETAKHLSTGELQTGGAADGIGRLCSVITPTTSAHATTLFSNAVIERRGALTALLTTAGFADVLSTGNELRYDLYLLDIDRAEPVIPESHRIEVKERIGASGDVIEPLTAAEVSRLVNVVRRLSVASVAVVLLHSYKNPQHEIVLGEALREVPGLAVSLSHEIVPMLGEYERASTASLNAYLQPLAGRYLRHVSEILEQVGAPRLGVMLSDGGVVTAQAAAALPVRLLESGPAAGALFAADVGREHGIGDVLSFDMGGTTAKICLVREGRPNTGDIFECARVFRFRRGSGLPVRAPVIDLIEVGAGGGSIVSVDPRGRVRIGPESAGADPGPACYGRGGTEPTVTDANVVLGYINPGTFLGGSMQLDRARAESAVASKVAVPLGVQTGDAAAGIVEVAVESMAAAARVYLAERGMDSRLVTLVAFGGAGPMHAVEIARRLAIRQVIVPLGAGVASALGLSAAAPAHEATATLLQSLDRCDEGAVTRTVGQLAERAVGALSDVGALGTVRTRTTAELRYVGQRNGLSIELDGDLRAITLEGLFRRRYLDLYGERIANGSVELVQVKVRAEAEGAGRGPKVRVSSEFLRSQRLAWSTEEARYVEHAVLSWPALVKSRSIRGPALLEQGDSTVLIPAHASGTLMSGEDLLITLERS